MTPAHAHLDFTGIRKRVLVSLFVTTVAATALVVAATAGGGRSAAGPGLFEATGGPHVQVSGLPGADLQPLKGLPGLSAASGPFPGVTTSVRHHGTEVDVWLEARSGLAGAVDHPLQQSGRSLEPGAVVLERSLAQRLGLRPGERVGVTTASGPRSLRVAGVISTSADRRYRSDARGAGAGVSIGFVLPRTLRSVAPNVRTWNSTMMLRLADPAKTATYVDWIRDRYPGAQVAVSGR
jgi:hypothetical protein